MFGSEYRTPQVEQARQKLEQAERDLQEAKKGAASLQKRHLFGKEWDDLKTAKRLVAAIERDRIGAKIALDSAIYDAKYNARLSRLSAQQRQIFDQKVAEAKRQLDNDMQNVKDTWFRNNPPANESVRRGHTTFYNNLADDEFLDIKMKILKDMQPNALSSLFKSKPKPADEEAIAAEFEEKAKKLMGNIEAKLDKVVKHVPEHQREQLQNNVQEMKSMYMQNAEAKAKEWEKNNPTATPKLGFKAVLDIFAKDGDQLIANVKAIAGVSATPSRLSKLFSKQK